MRRRIVLVSVMGAAVALLGWLVFQHVVTDIRIAFAEEQVTVFFEQAEKAENAEPIDAVRYLKYVIVYYPSGTKQVAGSRLDEIVEACREVAVARILAVLKHKTGKDLGADPAAWREVIQHAAKEQEKLSRPEN